MAMRTSVLLAGAAILLAPLTGALAQESYSSKDVVDFFVKEKELGAARAVCIGTAEECAKAQPAKPATFDLRVTFDLDSDQLTSDAKTQLKAFADALRDDRLAKLKFMVEGFTDATGTETYNMDLSVRRANAVVSFLKAEGVESDRLKPMGFGEARPRAEDPFDPSNRRVETRLAE
ncbi:Outer membrane porin F precursor [Hartmannibacter diazotrophicus]|uniref:Outer membrane porin F n=2 Tax=Hartmannibacter diazotrophicus TaxID=1482074 RepID=A0A2C9D110_9HYPH|nr:Outer membrane porin F precursor [Hartmannibacter diazotrophicus]